MVLKKCILILIVVFTLASCNKEEPIIVTSLENFGITIITPSNFESITPNQQVLFRGELSTNNKIIDPTKLRAVWTSDVDGVLQEGYLNNSGVSDLLISNLSRTVHKIKLSVYNEANELIFDEIEVYNLFKLFPIEKTSNSNTIKWNSNRSNNFISYNLYRSNSKYNFLNSEIIYSTTNSSDTTFVDRTSLLGYKYYYKVYYNRSVPSLPMVGSNIDSISTGNFLKLDYPILKMIADPNRNYAYGIVNLNYNSDINTTGYGLIFINTATQVVEKRILQTIRFSDLDFDTTGNYLYLCSKIKTIHKINLNTKELESTFLVTENALKLKQSNNKLYYQMIAPLNSSPQFRIYNLATSTNIPYASNITDAFASFQQGDFAVENNIIYHGESNSSFSKMSKIGVTNDFFTLIDQWDSNDYQLPKLKLRNNKLYWNHMILDTNLNRLGTFLVDNVEIPIQDVTPNGEFGIGYGNLLRTIDQTLFKKLPIYNYTDAIFLSNDQVLFYNTESPIYEQYETTLYFYKI